MSFFSFPLFVFLCEKLGWDGMKSLCVVSSVSSFPPSFLSTTNKHEHIGVPKPNLHPRECYCAPYLSALSSKLPDTSCDLPCIGNSTQICGGSLALSVYQTKTSTKGAAVKIANKAPVGSIMALGIAIGVLLCIA